MSRVDDALADAEARQTERDEIAAGDPLGYTIPTPTAADFVEANADVDVIRAGTPRVISARRPYVSPVLGRHWDSEYGHESDTNIY